VFLVADGVSWLTATRNAQELIDEFWNKRRKDKAAARKSEPIKSRPKSVTAKPSRKSLAQESSPEVVEAPASTKKRGRPRKSGVDSDVEVQAGSDEPRVKKKSRKSDGANRKADKPDSEDEVGNMNIHLHVPSWEHLIESVDTVERDSDGELIVYFTLCAPDFSAAFVAHSPRIYSKNGKGRKRENSRLCAERFPQKVCVKWLGFWPQITHFFLLQLIKFYESNLRWRVEEAEADN